MILYVLCEAYSERLPITAVQNGKFAQISTYLTSTSRQKYAQNAYAKSLPK